MDTTRITWATVKPNVGPAFLRAYWGRARIGTITMAVSGGGRVATCVLPDAEGHTGRVVLPTDEDGKTWMEERVRVFSTIVAEARVPHVSAVDADVVQRG